MVIVIGILLIVGLLAGLFIVRPRRARRARQLKDAKTAAQDDLLALNQQITDRDSNVAIQRNPDAAAEQAAALAAYERGTEALDAARKPTDMQAVSRNIAEAQYRLASAEALANGQPRRERRPSCFFDPRHGMSVADAPWTRPEGGPIRDVPVCAMDLHKIEQGIEPEMRRVEQTGSPTPVYYANSGFAPAYWGGYGLGPGLFTGFLLGEALSGPGWGYGWGPGWGWGEPGWDGGPGPGGGGDFGGGGTSAGGLRRGRLRRGRRQLRRLLTAAGADDLVVDLRIPGAAITAGVKRRAASVLHSAGSMAAAASTSPASSPGDSASHPVRPWLTSSGRQPRARPTTGVPSASDSTTAVPPGSAHCSGNSENRADATSWSRSRLARVPIQRTRTPSTSGRTWLAQ